MAPSVCRYMLLAILPITVVVLWVLSFFKLQNAYSQEAMGLAAVIIGISGIFLFYVFLYKLHRNSAEHENRKQRILIIHSVSVVLLIGIIQWLGMHSPWASETFWGNYDLQIVCKVFVIGVLVIGVISFLGSLFNIYWKDFFTRWY